MESNLRRSFPNKWEDSRMTVEMTAGRVSAIWWKKVNAQQIDEWDLVHQKDKPLGTKWLVSAIGGLGRMLFKVMTNKIIWWDHVVTMLQLPSFLSASSAERMFYPCRLVFDL